ncbi:MAG: UTP--glucose-1-phosphate uridylyltransferase [Alphaproteobacteria bacterium]|nr:MAG: UTP--glucose-1-phosphate uridylyltransferase [Alphaproteobacteria bacterium]
MTHIRKAIFPVGGLGTRFLPATKSVPKELLPIVDKPLIQFAVDEARAAGIEEFIFVTSRGKAAIEDYFDINYELEHSLAEANKVDLLDRLNPSNLPPGLAFFTRQQKPLGLGHAVWCARKFIGNEPFAVLLPDDLIMGKVPCLKQMVDAYAMHPGNIVASMDVPPPCVSNYGIIQLYNSPLPGTALKAVASVVEKPSLSEAPSTLAVIGRYILQPDVFDFLSKQKKGTGGEIQLTDAFNPLIASGQPFHALTFEGTRFDCGSKEGYIQATLFRARTDEELSTEFRAHL